MWPQFLLYPFFPFSILQLFSKKALKYHFENHSLKLNPYSLSPSDVLNSPAFSLQYFPWLPTDAGGECDITTPLWTLISLSAIILAPTLAHRAAITNSPQAHLPSQFLTGTYLSAKIRKSPLQMELAHGPSVCLESAGLRGTVNKLSAASNGKRSIQYFH